MSWAAENLLILRKWKVVGMAYNVKFSVYQLLRLGAKKKEALVGEKLVNTVVTVQRLDGV